MPNVPASFWTNFITLHTLSTLVLKQVGRKRVVTSSSHTATYTSHFCKASYRKHLPLVKAARIEMACKLLSVTVLALLVAAACAQVSCLGLQLTALQHTQRAAAGWSRLRSCRHLEWRLHGL